MKLKFIKPVFAHCDIPCGIYETDTMKHAADTCLRMIEKIEALEELDDDNTEQMANFVRMVSIKEESAQKVKDELCLLWTDYFKPEHLKKYPMLHEKVWLTAKQASMVKHTVSMQECKVLIEQVKEVATIFADSKK